MHTAEGGLSEAAELLELERSVNSFLHSVHEIVILEIVADVHWLVGSC